MPFAAPIEAVILQGRVVRLEPLGLGHAAALFEASREAAIWRFLTVPQPQREQEMSAWIGEALAHQAAGDHLPFATVRLSDGAVVGSTRFLEIKPYERTVEIGWTWLSAQAQRTAINTEAKLLMLEHAFGALGCVRVQLKTDALNEKSRRAIERIGCRFEGVLRSFQRYWHGGLRDTAMYSLLDSEWPEAKAALEQKLSAR